MRKHIHFFILIFLILQSFGLAQSELQLRVFERLISSYQLNNSLYIGKNEIHTSRASAVAVQAIPNENIIEISERPAVLPTPASCVKISGIINTYTAVTQISNSKTFVTVFDASGFKKDDQVLLIQMQGAEIDTTNTAKYGIVKDIRGAGDYEFAVIAGVNGNTVTFTKSLSGINYDVSGKIQLVSVPEYSKAIVRDSLTAAPWNGTMGGILALSANCLSLEGKIDVSGRGFRGGAYSINPLKPKKSDSLYATSLPHFANKGEGIAGYGSGANLLGRGAPASGGGGGNSHNGGGGGGSNAGRGGKGGFGYELATNPQIAGGLGGSYTNISPEKILMGGGGGAGQVNDGHGSAGGAGGGIIIIRADIIENKSSFTISANGQSAANDTDLTNPDGCGGGGAGGTIVLDAKFNDNPAVLFLNGGDGGSRMGSTVGHGTGGGAGGGKLITTDTTIYNLATAHLDGGAAGIALEGDTYGATAGLAGTRLKIDKSDIAGFLKPMESTGCQGCYPTIQTAQQLCSPATFSVKDELYPLQSVELDQSQSSNIEMKLSGSLPAGEITGTLTLLDPAKPGTFVIRAGNSADNAASYTSQVYPTPVPIITAAGANLLVNSQTGDIHQWSLNGALISGATGKTFKPTATGNYTVQTTNKYGCTGVSTKLNVIISGLEEEMLHDDAFTLYPNPVTEMITVESRRAFSLPVSIEIQNILGESFFKNTYGTDANRFTAIVSLADMPSGTYFVHLTTGSFKKVYKIVRK